MKSAYKYPTGIIELLLYRKPVMVLALCDFWGRIIIKSDLCCSRTGGKMDQAGLMAGTCNEDLLRMMVADESNRVLPTIESLFKDEYFISSIEPASFDGAGCDGECHPDIVIYLCKKDVTHVVPRIRRIRSEWPKTVVLLLLPGVVADHQSNDILKIPAHQIVFKPCTKKKIVDVVENYRSLMRSDENGNQDHGLLTCMMEFAGSLRPDLYVAYNRIMPMIMTICQKLGFDWRHVQKVFSILMLLLSNVDEKLVKALMQGEGRKAKILKEIYGHVEKMADLLSMNPATEDMAEDLKYVLKRYDGEGQPDDDVSGQNIPPTSRIIRILMDYHYLLQGGKSTGQALYILNKRTGWYDDVLFHVLVEVQGDEGQRCTREVYPLGLVSGMVVAEDIYGNIDGRRTKVLSRNEMLTDETIDYLQRHCEDILDITEPIKVVEELFSDKEAVHA